MLDGLKEVSTDDLKRLFRLVAKNELNCPVTAWELARNGFQHCQEPMLSQFRGLDLAGVRAVLTAVLAERLPRF